MSNGSDYIACEFGEINPMHDLIVSVHTKFWVRDVTKIHYMGFDMMLIPESNDNDAMIILPLVQVLVRNHTQCKLHEVFSIILKLLSSLTWKYKEPFTCSTLMSCLAHIGKVKYNRNTVREFIIIDKLPVGSDKKSRLALALYREGLSCNNLAMRYLSYSKVVNVLYHGKNQINQLNRIIPCLNKEDSKSRVIKLGHEMVNIGEHLYKSGRCAIAHAYNEPVVDPDEPADLYTLHLDLPIIKEIAEHIIENEFVLQEVAVI